jgi:hypothetical protein
MPNVSFKFNGGRTGNILFAYLTAKLIEVKFGHTYVTCDLLKEDAFDITESNIEDVLENPPAELFEKDVHCKGYFQKSDLFIKYRKELLDCLYNTQDIWVENGNTTYVRDFLHTPHKYKLKENDIVMNLRLDDFIQRPCPTSDIIPPQHYMNILENYKFDFNQLYIVCDTIRHDWEREYLKFFDKWNPILIQENILHDCAIMREAPTLIHSNSTLCWMMSFFANTSKKRYIPRTNFYAGQKLGKIDEETDTLIEVKPMHHHDVFNLSYNQYALSNIFPLPYCIPDEYVVNEVPPKKSMFSKLIPGDRTTYIYGVNDEAEYHAMYGESRFARTCKKGGWDCMRHYEIMCNGTIPLFEGIENCPEHSLVSIPKSILKEVNNMDWKDFKEENWEKEDYEKYDKYAEMCLNHFRENCTTSANVSKYFFPHIPNSQNIKKVLMIRCNIGVNYTREMLWIGMTRYIDSIGGEAIDYPKIPYLYEDFPNSEKPIIHGYGYGFAQKIKCQNKTYDDTSIYNSIDNNYWDLIIYGKIGRDEYHEGTIPNLPFWDIVKKRYVRDNIAFLYGGDGCHNMNSDSPYKSHILYHSRFANCFVRELQK